MFVKNKTPDNVLLTKECKNNISVNSRPVININRIINLDI